MKLQRHLSADPQLSQSLQPQLYPPLDLLAPWHKSGVKSLVAEALVYQYKHLGVLKTLTAKGTCYVWLETLLCKNKELEGCQDCCCNTTAIATWYMHFRTTSQVSYKSNVLMLVDNAGYLHSRWNGNHCYQTTCQQNYKDHRTLQKNKLSLSLQLQFLWHGCVMLLGMTLRLWGLTSLKESLTPVSLKTKSAPT